MNVIPIRQEGAKHTGPTELPPKIVIDGNPVYDTWTSAEVAVNGTMSMGTWIGEPGTINMRGYPADEMFTLVFGQVEITNEDGSMLVLNPGDSGFVRKGWKGTWRNVERSCKLFASVGDWVPQTSHPRRVHLNS